jgi:hypothetical protein
VPSLIETMPFEILFPKPFSFSGNYRDARAFRMSSR